MRDKIGTDRQGCSHRRLGGLLTEMVLSHLSQGRCTEKGREARPVPRRGWVPCVSPPLLFATGLLLLATLLRADSSPTSRRPVVVEIDLDNIVEPITAEYVERGIEHANQIQAAAVILELSTPGGLESSMRDIVKTVISSRVPIITYVAPSGSRAASAGFFILLAGDVAAMAPGTNTGAAHPVLMNGADIGKTLGEKIENDAAAYIRSIADKRGRNVQLAEAGVRQSKSFTEKEALQNHLIDLVADSPQELLSRLDGRTVKRFEGGTATLHLQNAKIEPYVMTSRQRFLSRIADPNIAFILGALGVLCLYLEFTHPGMVLPGVGGAIAVILALYAFHLLPINYTGVALIILAFILFALEVKVSSHGVLAVGGIIAMIIGSLILVQSPLPGAQIHFGTSLSVTIPIAVITIILVRVALEAQKRKAVTGADGLVDAVGIANTDLSPEGQVLIRGELWKARAGRAVPSGSRIRVRKVEGLTLEVEPEKPEP